MVRYLLPLLMILNALTTRTAQADLRWQGYQKLYLLHERYSEPESLMIQRRQDNILQASGRLQVDWQASEPCSFQAAAIYQIIEQSKQRGILEKQIEEFSSPSYRVWDAFGEERNSDRTDRELLLRYDLDRLLLACHLSHFDLHVGRQAITFGSSRVISPGDIILPYGLLVLDQEYRIGVDGIRLQYPLGRLSVFDIGLVFDQSQKQELAATGFFRTKISWQEADWTALWIVKDEAYLINLGYEGQLAGWATWLDVAQVFLKDSLPDERDYLRLSIGGEYFFPNQTHFMLEYHINQAGSKRLEESWLKQRHFAYREGGVFLLGQQYMTAAVSYPLTPLTQITGQLMLNINDMSSLWTPILRHSLADEIIWQLGAFYSPSQSNSEFAQYPRRIYSELAWYF